MPDFEIAIQPPQGRTTGCWGCHGRAAASTWLVTPASSAWLQDVLQIACWLQQQPGASPLVQTCVVSSDPFWTWGTRADVYQTGLKIPLRPNPPSESERLFRIPWTSGEWPVFLHGILAAILSQDSNL